MISLLLAYFIGPMFNAWKTGAARKLKLKYTKPINFNCYEFSVVKTKKKLGQRWEIWFSLVRLCFLYIFKNDMQSHFVLDIHCRSIRKTENLVLLDFKHSYIISVFEILDTKSFLILTFLFTSSFLKLSTRHFKNARLK